MIADVRSFPSHWPIEDRLFLAALAEHEALSEPSHDGRSAFRVALDIARHTTFEIKTEG